VLGKATLAAAADVAEGLAVALRPRVHGSNATQAEVLSVEGAEVYLSLGSDGGVRAGYRFAVVPGPSRESAVAGAGQRIAVIEIEEVISARLSRARTVSASGQVQVGDRVELLSP
jgi:hypothetical protein